MKTTNINIRIAPELKKELSAQAELKGKDLSTYLLEEILLQLAGHYVRCPKCQKPCFDNREISITGTATVKCLFCRSEFEHVFE